MAMLIGKSLSKMSDSVGISYSGAKSAEVIVSITDLFIPGGVKSLGLPLFIMQTLFVSTMLARTIGFSPRGSDAR